MKKYFLLLIIISIALISLTFIACHKKDKQADNKAEDDYFVYNINENIHSFNVDKNGILYYLTSSETVDDNHTSYIKTLDFSGSLINTYQIDNTPAIIALGSGNIYYTVNSEKGVTLYKFPIDSKESVKITDITDYSSVKQMTVVDDKLYFLGININNVNKEYKLANNDDRFSYSGETLGYIDLNNASYYKLAVDFPISFSKTLDDNILIYAYDEDGGYYLNEFNTKDSKFTDKTYHTINMLNKFAVYNEEKDFVFQKSHGNTLALISASIDPAKGETDLVPNFKGGAHLLCHNGYTFCTNFDTTKIIRLNNLSFMHENEKITMLSNDYYDYFLPFGCGYTIDQRFLSDEEMALALLSQDKSFDICFMNSGQTISENIRNKGSFYPLNEVEGVQEYLDACFPYIRDAATNSEGDIWMLPIAVDMPVLFYNEKICKENNIELNASTEANDFFAILKKFDQNDDLSELYCYDRVSIMNNFFNQYLRKSKDFNSDEFKKLAENIKSDMKYSESRYNGDLGLFPSFSSNTNNDFALLFSEDHIYQYNVSERDGIRACGLPLITDNKTNMTNCYFFCVNPESKNLKETLQYISSYCDYLMSLKELMIFKDRNIYHQSILMDDLYNIYSNGDIQFTMPKELYMDDFNEYLQGERELQDVINDSNRRLDIFLNE